MLLVPSAGAELVVIANRANHAQISTDSINKIYLGRTRRFTGGEFTKPVDQPEGREIRQQFISAYLHKTEPALKSYWSTLVFTGNGTPPAVLLDDEAVKKYVSITPGGIGYIDSKSLDDSVKVVIAGP